MKTTKNWKTITGAALLFCIVLALTNCSSPSNGNGNGNGNGDGNDNKSAKIGISVLSNTSGWEGGVSWWAQEKATELKSKYPGIEFKIVNSSDAVQQEQDLKTLFDWGMEFLVILPIDGPPLTEAVASYAAKGIRCIVFDRALSRTDFGYVFISGDNEGMGRLSGEWLRNTMQAESLTNYVAIGGMNVQIDTDRMDAFFVEMEKAPSLTNLEGARKYEYAYWNANDGEDTMSGYLSIYPAIDAVYCQDDEILMGAKKAIDDAGRTDIKLILGGGGSKEVYKLIMDSVSGPEKRVRASAQYHPSMIADAIQYAVDVVLGNKSDFTNTSAYKSEVIPSVLVTSANVSQYYNPNSSY